MQPQVPEEPLDQRLLPFRGDALQLALNLPRKATAQGRRRLCIAGEERTPTTESVTQVSLLTVENPERPSDAGAVKPARQ
jgi:hypothetical protein